MRLVLVNYCHPATPHVCGRRVPQFAEVLAAAGHQVVLVTRDLEGEAVAPPPEGLAEALAAHDWSRPLLLAVPPRPSTLCRRVQEGNLPPIWRKPAIALLYLIRGGLFADWRQACDAYARPLARHFRPELAWGTFGNTDTLLVARRLARAAGAPWVMDTKDYWGMFIPAPLRRLLARRFADAAHLTAFSVTHGAEAARWFSMAATVVYSGIPETFLPATSPPPERLTLTLSGSVYSRFLLARLLATLAAWGRGRPERPRLIYAGGDHAAFGHAVAEAGLGPDWEVEIHPYLALEDLRRLTVAASANLYLKSERTFHHKVIELLSAGRPVVSFPAEGEEAPLLAYAMGGALLSCADEGDLTAALDRLAAGEPFAAATAEGMRPFTWAAQAETLARLFQAVAGRRR